MGSHAEHGNQAEKPVTELYKACIPFMLVLLFALLLITYIPAISLVFL